MIEITNILDMLDWNAPADIQSVGRAMARNIQVLEPFIQPLTPKYNKNVWENCAIILSEKNDEELKPYLPELLEWLQDMNWPGAFRIRDRLQRFSDKNKLQRAISICIEKSRDLGDEIWERNLLWLISKH